MSSVIHITVLALMLAVMAFAEPSRGRVEFRSGMKDNSLAFHGRHQAPPGLPARAVAAEHNRMVTCTCVARTADRNELRRGASRAPIEWVGRMTFAACEGQDGKLLDGKIYKAANKVTTACSPKNPLGPSLASLAGATAEPDTCRTYDAETQPAFWYCQASR